MLSQAEIDVKITFQFEFQKKDTYHTLENGKNQGGHLLTRHQINSYIGPSCTR